MTNQAVSVGGGSVLGKYYTSIRLYKYERENPFTPGPESNTEISDTKINLPLPIQLYDRSASSFSHQNMGVIGDLINEGFSGGISEPLVTSALLRAGSAFGGAAVNSLLSGPLARNIDINAVTTAIEQTLGFTPNPNPAVKFNGPVLRSFNYTWYLAPKNETESKSIRKIIQTLKAASLPGRINSSTALLTIPKLAQINFYPWDQGGESKTWGWTENSIIKTKRCHITNVSVNYNPANVPAFFRDHNPVIIELSVELMEVEYMFEEDWRDLGNDPSLPGSDAIAALGTTITDLGASLAGNVVTEALP